MDRFIDSLRNKKVSKKTKRNNRVLFVNFWSEALDSRYSSSKTGKLLVFYWLKYSGNKRKFCANVNFFNDIFKKNQELQYFDSIFALQEKSYENNVDV